MNKKIDDGGSAFPFNYEQSKNLDGTWNQTGNFENGMTLRQWYAGMALQGMNTSDPSVMARVAYMIADAMIAEEKKGKEE